jgi:hypothetical protein
MIRYLLLVVNSLALFIFGLITGEDAITVTSTIPSVIAAGEDAKAELRVKKGTVAGYGRLTLQLPEGVVIKDVEEKESRYSFTDGAAEWEWDEAPSDDEIIIHFSLIASETVTGVRTITAKYSYIADNVKQMAEMTPHEISILPPGADLAAAATQRPAVSTTVVTGDSAGSRTFSLPAENSQREPARIVQVKREVGFSAAGEMLVKIRISKDGTKGFARYSDDMNKDFSVKPVETDGSSFSIADDKIRFVWVAVPEKDDLTVSYILSSRKNGSYTLRGEYSYIDENQSKKIALDPETIEFAKDNEEVKKTVSSEEIKKEISEAKTVSAPKEAEGQVVYQVQIGAFTKTKGGARRLVKKFGIKEKINSEMHEGFSKFMVGRYGQYADARTHREEIRNSNRIKGAFVVAYNHGKRITVQEALMVTNQKWFK